MSYDAYVSCHTCGEALNHANTSVPGGIDLLLRALGCPLRDWNGMTGVTVLPMLHAAVQRLSDDVDALRRDFEKTPLEWSPIDVAAKILPAMRDAICRDPWAVIHVG